MSAADAPLAAAARLIAQERQGERRDERPAPRATARPELSRPGLRPPAGEASRPSASRPAPAAATPAGDAVEPLLQGRVDALEGERLFGWVWDPGRPEERIGVRVRLDGADVASGLADRVRVDLRRNGIGDGGHAFEIALPPEVAAAGPRLAVVAYDVATGVETVLRAPTPDERAAEAAVAAPLARVLDRLDRLVLAQRQLQLGQKGVLDKVDAVMASETGLGEMVETVRAGQQELGQRLEQMEVFLVRFDNALSGFDGRLKSLADRHRSELKPQMLVLAAMIGVAIGLAVGLAIVG